MCRSWAWCRALGERRSGTVWCTDGGGAGEDYSLLGRVGKPKERDVDRVAVCWPEKGSKVAS
jgi:hypothetical protein